MKNEVRLLKDWNPQKGDVFLFKFTEYTWKNYKKGAVVSDGRWISDMAAVTLVSRANQTPRPFGELTDAKKGALLLAHHEGKRIEVFIMSFGIRTWSQLTSASFFDHMPYRIAPTRIKGSVETDADGKPMFDTWEADQ